MGSQGWTVLGVPVDSVAAPAGGPAFGTELAPGGVGGAVGWPRVGAGVAAPRAAVTGLLADGRRPLLLGGCCTILMGAAPAARDVLGRVGLAYVDGHVDVYDNRTSPTGEAADLPAAALPARGW